MGLNKATINNMTLEELKKIPFKMVQHLVFEGTHMATYKSEQLDSPIFCRTTCRIKKNGDFGKTSRTYIYKGGFYRNIHKLLEAINGTQ